MGKWMNKFIIVLPCVIEVFMGQESKSILKSREKEQKQEIHNSNGLNTREI